MSEPLIRRRSLPDSLRYLAEKLNDPLTDAERAGIALTLNSLADEVATERDAFAHELAERQRMWALDYVGDGDDSSYDYTYAVTLGAKLAADLIDPSAGPARPDEEPTS